MSLDNTQGAGLDGVIGAGMEMSVNVSTSQYITSSHGLIPRMGVDAGGLLDTTGLYLPSGSAALSLPEQYATDEILTTQDLTEEDRRLAAALVAVQLVQQQKQQQLLLHDAGSVPSHSLSALTHLGPSKLDVEAQSLVMSPMDKPAMAAMVNSYIRSVENDPNVGHVDIYEVTDPDRSLTNTACTETSRERRRKQKFTLSPIAADSPIKEEFATIKSEAEEGSDETALDSDYDARHGPGASKKSLPHKKRISRKLKNHDRKSRLTSKDSSNADMKYFKCTACGENFSVDRSERQSYGRALDSTKTCSFTCQLCSETFADQMKFFEHLKYHYEPPPSIEEENVEHEQRRRQQIDGTGMFLDQSRLIVSNAITSPSNIRCLDCGKTFRRQKAYESHVRDSHPANLEVDEFSEPEDLMDGIRVVVDDEDLTGIGADDQSVHVSQSVDNLTVDSKTWYDLGATEADLQEIEERCEVPPPHEYNGDILKKRLKGRVGPRTCEICNRTFNHRNSYVYHMRSHSGERPHQCDQCGKSFFASSALKVHQRMHTGDKPYKCEHCGRHFRQWGDLKYHCNSIHSDRKQYQCEYCGKDFARKYSLIVHRRIHTGEKNYACEYCDKKFRASSYLQNHRRIHTGEKPHPCTVCGKSFRVRSDMKRHMATHGRAKVTTQSTQNRLSELGNEIETAIEDDTQPEQKGSSVLPVKTEICLETEEMIIDAKEEDVMDPLADRDNTNTLYVWPVYMD